MQNKDHFKDRADVWEKGANGDVRISGARKIADSIKNSIKLTGDMEILDFGVGTGLLGFEIASSVKKVYGVDTSQNMIKKLQEKNSSDLSIEGYCQNIIEKPLEKSFNGLISSMTLHHIEDLKLFFETIAKNIKDGGFIAIADLVSEDGTFHSNNDGVFHFGFDKDKLSEFVRNSGFKDIEFKIINTISKPHGDFDIFLLSAKK